MRIKLCSILIVISFLITCDDNDTKTYNISGKVQKGPFQIGSDITLIELDNSLNPTGRTFFSTIIDNEGNFEFPEVEFSSDYIEIKAEGSYYDEAVDAFSYQNITLFTLSRLKDLETINVNILTHIQRERIKKLIDDGLPFELAYKQSQKELLTIFGFENYVLDDFLNLDINDESNGSSILLVISMIIATHNNVLQEFITQLSTDFKDDGKIDSEDLQHRLVNTAKFLSPDIILNNLRNYYSQNQIEFKITEIKSFIDTFLINTDFKSTLDFSLPETALNGPNLLIQNDSIFIFDQCDYSISINIPDDFIDYTIIVYLTKIEGTGGWNLLDNSHWNIFYYSSDKQNLSLNNQTGINAETGISFYGSGAASLGFYFEVISFDINFYGRKEFTDTIYWDCK